MSVLRSHGKVEQASKRNYVSLIRELAITEFKLKYQGSVIGYFWSLVKPLAIFGVLYLVFTVFVRIGSGIKHYPVYLLTGIVLWNYFAESTIASMRSIVDKGDLIRKVYFPRIVILLASSLSALITLVLNLLIIALFILGAGIHPTLGYGLFLLLLIELYLVSLGVSLFLSALYVKFRDFAYIWEVALQLLFYSSAVIFPLDIVPKRYLHLITLNPVTQIIQDSRYVLVSKQTITVLGINHTVLAYIPYLIPPLLTIFGYLYFRSAADKFAEEL